MFKYTVEICIECLQSLIEKPYGKSRLEKTIGKLLAVDIDPFLHGDYSSIYILEHKYNFYDEYHTDEYNKFVKTSREVRRLRGETTSYMMDKMCYYSDAYYYISTLRTLLEDAK